MRAIQRSVDREMVEELKKELILFSEEQLVFTVRSYMGNVVFLEQGNANSGLQHIRNRHIISGQFEEVGLKDEQAVIDFIKNKVTTNPISAHPAKEHHYYAAPDGTHRIRIVIAGNGYIVTAYPDGNL